MITRLLVWLGVLTKCCHARKFTPEGWDKQYCCNCGRKVYGNGYYY